MTRFLDFDLLVTQNEEEFEARVLRSPAGEARHRFAAPFTELEIENLLLRLGRSRRVRRGGFDTDATRAAKHFGGRLYEAVFGGAVRSCLELSVREAQTTRACLRIRLRIDAPEFADVPWEYLYDAAQNRFLALSSATSLVRYLELSSPLRPAEIDGAMRVVVMIASPKDHPQLDADREWANLQNAFRELPHVQIERIRPTVGALQACLRRGRAHVFHFIGHGDFDERAGDGLVVLEDEHGGSDLVPSAKLAVILHNHPDLRLAVLNCCEGARTAGAQPFSGVAPALVQQGLPAVVAMQFAIADTAAITFARTFYESLADGLPIDRAVVEARTAMFVEEDESFGAPVLYMRSDQGVLFDTSLRSAAAATPAPQQPVPARPEPIVEPAPPEPREPARTAPARSQESRGRRSWVRTLAFGIAWALVSLFAAGQVSVGAGQVHDSAFARIAAWSRVTIFFAAAQVALFLILSRRRQAGAPGAARLLGWIAASGFAAALAAGLTEIVLAPAKHGAMLETQYWLSSAAYLLVRAAVLRRHLSPSSLFALSGTAAAAFTAGGMVTIFGSLDAIVAGVFAAAVLLFVEGAILHRATFSASAPAPESRTVAMTILAAAAIVLLLALTPLADPSDAKVEATATDTTPTMATDTGPPVPDPLPGPTPAEAAAKGSIEGVVIGPDGQPYAGAKIESGALGFLGYPYSAVSQSDGYYSLGLVDPGEYTVHVELPGDVRDSTEDVVVSPGTISIVNTKVSRESRQRRDWDRRTRPLLPHTFRSLERAPAAMRGAVRGTVTGPGGVPLQGAAVTLDDSEFSLLPDPTAVTAADGSFEFPAVPWGEYYVVAKHAGYGNLTMNGLKVYPRKVSLLSMPLLRGDQQADQRTDWTPDTREMTAEEKAAAK